MSDGREAQPAPRSPVGETGQPRATIVVTPRERFGVAVESLRSIVADTAAPYELVYVDGGSPTGVAGELTTVCREHGFRYLRFDHFLSPNQARNIGFRAASTPYVVFVDNDVIVAPGWLDALIACADETQAEVVAPLTCQKLPLHQEIHQAGGRFTDDLSAFWQRPSAERRIDEEHVHQGRRVDEVHLERGETQCCEFHCALVCRRVLEDVGGLDEQLLATKEHIDFCMGVWQRGGRVIFEPKSVVTYLFPNRAKPLTRADWPYFTLRWSPTWQRQSLEHFQRKWGLEGDAYFEAREQGLTWRYREGLARPLVRRLPGVSSIPFLQRVGVGVAVRAFDVWSRLLAASQRRRAAATRAA